ncbi:unnamed protein product [Parnassius mnemosyne]|uniref:Kv channel-interacting protein 4 n=1 Tax=Parnassius mnemosyne TaxID=213953 RepID=A0AAV1LCV9_9NEOP
MWGRFWKKEFIIKSPSFSMKSASCWPLGFQEECEESTSLPVPYRPEPPAALARASRFSPHEIKLMYRGFKQECPTGMVDEESFKNIFSQFFHLGDASQYAHFVFNVVKHKHGGKLSFEVSLLVLLVNCDIRRSVKCLNIWAYLENK